MKTINKYRLIKNLFVFLVLLTFLSLESADALANWSGKVVGVSDGDTITIIKEGRGVKIRLAEIDCPERGQPFGAKAKRLTSDLCFGKEVTVQPTGIDRYGRTVAHVILPDGHNLSEDLVQYGLAWQYKEYSTSKKLAKIEASAREAKLGIWSESNPVPPWEWRHGKINNKSNQLSNQATSASTASGYHGNIKSKIFHAKNCRYFNCGNCTAVFSTREEAINAGYRPCKICKP